MRQVPLDIGLSDCARLTDFHAGPNRQALEAVRGIARGCDEPLIVVTGPSASGKSHLLHGACHEAATTGSQAAYVPLRSPRALRPHALEGLEMLDLVCIDDLDDIAGEKAWESALFKLFNHLREQGGRLLIATTVPTAQLELHLTDLRSRLGWGITYRLAELDDADKATVICNRAARRGLDMPAETARYLLTHCTRDLRSLSLVVDRLDRASLEAQRRLTIPFVRQALRSQSLTG